MANKAMGFIFALLWILLLFFVAWPVAGICCGFWLLLQPFESILPPIKQCNDFLEKIITWPRECGQAIFNCQESFPKPF